MAYDEQAAEQHVNQAFALFSPETVAVELLQQGIARVGEGWYRDEVTVQQEHFCSALVIRRLEALIMAVPPSSRPGRILVACPPQEEHVIGPLLLTYLLRRRGWDVVYLGANTPVERVTATVATAEPQLVVSAAQRLRTAATLAQAAPFWQAEGVLLAYGGLVFNLIPELRTRIAGHFLGEQMGDAVPALESLMSNPIPVPSVERTPEALLQARAAFEESKALIEADVAHSLRSQGIGHHHLALANRELGQNIDAALALGDLRFLGTDIEWIAGLLRHYRLPPEALHAYLAVYHREAATHLDERGQPIVAWLGEMLRAQGTDRQRDIN
jgi:methylmalonyl-CoA mutase cobalamin-binding subunit